MTHRRLSMALLLLAVPAPVGAQAIILPVVEPAPVLPEPVRAMIDAAIATGDEAKVRTVVDLAKATNPDAKAEIEALAKAFGDTKSDQRRLAEEKRLAAIREAGVHIGVDPLYVSNETELVTLMGRDAYDVLAAACAEHIRSRSALALHPASPPRPSSSGSRDRRR